MIIAISFVKPMFQYIKEFIQYQWDEDYSIYE